MTKKNFSAGFTLIELLIVLAIIGILATLGFSSYMNSVKSGHDARRKSDLRAIQNALELYYQDNESYPGSLPFGSSFCHPTDCDTAKYMETIPKDPSGSDYTYVSDGTTYQLYSCIENPNDSGPGVQNYAPSCGSGVCDPCRFGVSSPNSSP